MDFRAEPCGCTLQIGMSRSREVHLCDHGNRLVYTKALGTRKPGDGPARYSTFPNRGGGISVASPEQRAKVDGAISIISGEGPCDPAHLWDRRLGGCDSELCVIPLTRPEHRDYEEKRLDILPALVAGGFFAEMAHVIEVHRVSPTVLAQRLSGTIFHTRTEVESLQARIVELESAIHV